MKTTDARVRYTRRAIKESFLALLREKPVNRITVKEVCERAELNRATFYTHYGNCFILLDSIEQELLDSFKQSLSLIGSFDVSALICAIYAMIQQHEDACRVLIFDGKSATVLDRMIAMGRESSLAHWRQLFPLTSEKDLEMLYTYLSNGLVHVIVEGYGKYDREDVVRFVDRIVNSSLAPYR